ncbi:hypothetical protein OHC33_009233 [Knufia fluminis]|uniref:Arrestin-like N-terminal domain-containing protein n=1 Tax=Knufia fluminis TaxID=191047 RepID=A0AAN8ELS9_9EURO|nr:hypothetical protein OHC33_009233 [Knufia fluminis]
MHLSFHFEDFFHDKGTSTDVLSDVKIPTFLVQNGVLGDLQIRDLKESLLNHENARVEVDLEGFMRTELDTCVHSHSEFRVTVEKKVGRPKAKPSTALIIQVLSMTQALSIRSHATNDPENVRKYPFSFDVQSWLRYDEASGNHSRILESRSNYVSIPPSLRHEILTTPQGVRRPRAGAHVGYKLTARLLKDHRVVDRIVQPILLFLSQPPCPPMCVTDFKGEYRSFQKSALRGALFQKVGDISVVVQEPKQLTVRADRADSIVEVPVKLLFEQTKGNAALSDQPTIEADVKWTFRFLTFVSMQEQQGPPTLKGALVSPATAFVRSSLKSRYVKMVWRKWSKVAVKGRASCIASEQSLWLTLPRSEVLTPTFWSPFLSRRYSICLQLKVMKPGAAKLEVEVPIQVGIEGGTAEGDYASSRPAALGNDEFIFDDVEGDELLPQYSR